MTDNERVLIEALEDMLVATKRVIESNIDSDIWYRVTRAQERGRRAITHVRGETSGENASHHN